MFKITFRHLWRKKLFTALNVLGLAIGISACWVIYSVVSYEFSFEKDLPNKENIYRLVSAYEFDGKESYSGGVSKPVYQGIREQVTGVDRVVPVFEQFMKSVEIPNGGATAKVFEFDGRQNIVATDSSYFEIVPYTWLAGNATHALNSPDQVVLTKRRAEKYFGSLAPEEIIGKTLSYIGYSDTLHKTVSGIVQNLNYSTEFSAQEFFFLAPNAYSLSSWTNTSGDDKAYIQMVGNSSPAAVLDQINELANQKYKELEQELDRSLPNRRKLELLPLTESHFSTHINEYLVHKASKPILYGLIGTGVFLLLLACINFINMTTAQIPQRSKEIGVRKTLGGSRGSLAKQLFAETFFIASFALFLAFFMTKLAFKLLADIIPEESLEYMDNTNALLFLLGLILLITFLAGSYPAWLVARLQPVTILRATTILTVGNTRVSLRKGLIIFQFVIAQLFIVCALISGAQLRYTLKKNMGFERDAVVLVDVHWKLLMNKTYEGKIFTLAEELKRESGISMISLGRAPMSESRASYAYEYADGDLQDPIRHQVIIKEIDTNYIHLYEMELLAGRNLHASDTLKEYVINEAAVKAFSFASPQDAIGKLIGERGKKLPIVGVVKDFHLENFYSNIEPAALYSDKRGLSTLNIKLNTNDPARWQETLKTIEQKWYTIYPPETFEYKFYDETIEAMYKQERSLSKLVNLATTIAIIISCLGLFGLATLTAYQRVKEIGVRKVLGSSVMGIVQLLSKDFVKLVLIAILIASPIAWWAMNKWLQDFAYRINIKWWMFALAGGMSVVIALLTVSFQSVKAAIANPVDSLRDE
jgi:ABC-type antimicrobial peptide transport system permease subunit